MTLALGELREEVIYALQQPLIRLHDVAFNRDKKMVKRVLKNQARVMGAGPITSWTMIYWT